MYPNFDNIRKHKCLFKSKMSSMVAISFDMKQGAPETESVTSGFRIIRDMWESFPDHDAFYISLELGTVQALCKAKPKFFKHPT